MLDSIYAGDGNKSFMDFAYASGWWLWAGSVVLFLAYKAWSDGPRLLRSSRDAVHEWVRERRPTVRAQVLVNPDTGQYIVRNQQYQLNLPEGYEVLLHADIPIHRRKGHKTVKATERDDG